MLERLLVILVYIALYALAVLATTFVLYAVVWLSIHAFMINPILGVAVLAAFFFLPALTIIIWDEVRAW